MKVYKVYFNSQPQHTEAPVLHHQTVSALCVPVKRVFPSLINVALHKQSHQTTVLCFALVDNDRFIRNLVLLLLKLGIFFFFGAAHYSLYVAVTGLPGCLSLPPPHGQYSISLFTGNNPKVTKCTKNNSIDLTQTSDF